MAKRFERFHEKWEVCVVQIDLANDEYRLLLEVLDISYSVMQGFASDGERDAKAYMDLEQKLLSCAETAGLADLVMYDERLKNLYLTREFEERSPGTQFLDDFVNDSLERQVRSAHRRQASGLWAEGQSTKM